MQHYGLPTRLLDVTYNPLVSLYFACSKDTEDDGEFIILEVKTEDIKYFDSDTVSCIANLSNLTGKQRDRIRNFTETSELNNDEVGVKLLHFINSEKPYFQQRIILDDLKRILAVRPKQTNQRILAQQGAFLIFGLRSTLIERNIFGITIRRAKVPASAKGNLLQELDDININGRALFPEIESAAKYILSKIPPLENFDEKPD